MALRYLRLPRMWLRMFWGRREKLQAIQRPRLVSGTCESTLSFLIVLAMSVGPGG